MKNITLLSSCSGLAVTSFIKYDSSRKFEKKLSSSIKQYRKFKKIHEISSNLKEQFNVDYFLKLELKYVRIYFDATTFDKIYKDKAAKFVDMLSAVGGTMGLLTGFSIISAVEVVYFFAKFIYEALKKN